MANTPPRSLEPEDGPRRNPLVSPIQATQGSSPSPANPSTPRDGRTPPAADHEPAADSASVSGPPSHRDRWILLGGVAVGLAVLA